MVFKAPQVIFMCSQECEPVIKAVKSDLCRPYPFPMESDTPERGPSDVLTSAPSDSEQVNLETHCNRKYVEREAGREEEAVEGLRGKENMGTEQ